MTKGLDINLHKRLDGFDLKVHFDVPPGLSVFFGDSGAGKSLTLRMIAGLMRSDKGRVTLDDRVLFDHSEQIWVRPQDRRFGFVFQQESLFPHLSVFENILFGGRGLAKVERNTQARELLQRLRLETLADKPPQEISGGQKQRVAIARTLMMRPGAMLLDEPFSALDLLNRKVMRDCLVEVMRGLEIPVILVTHDLVEALTLADQLIILSEGRILQRGSPEEIVAHPANDHVAALVNPENLRIPFLENIVGDGPCATSDSASRSGDHREAHSGDDCSR